MFTLHEAIAANLSELGKPILALGPPTSWNASDYLACNVRPSVCTVEQARALRLARPVLCLDTGMQRFACSPQYAHAVLSAGACDEAFTHATTIEQAAQLRDVLAGQGLRLHAAASSLLDQPSAWLDAVRPGLALYRSAVHVSATLYEARTSTGPVGYTGFRTARHGVILAGYSNGLRPGPCLVNGQPRRILEVGMQTSYIGLAPDDHRGDEVVLLGDGLTENHVAEAWGTSPQEVLMHLTHAGVRRYE